MDTTGQRRRLSNVLTLAMLVALVIGASLLPPDTSLRLVREQGTLRVCVPSDYPPLVTTDAQRPGLDIEILERVAAELGVRLQEVRVPAIGRDFNPRNWRITRAQCELVAGGVVATPTTRSFLETTAAHLETGWAIVYPASFNSGQLANSRVSFVSGASGLNRIALSAYLRSLGVSVAIAQDVSSAVSLVEGGETQAVVTESLLARRIAADHDWTAAYMPEPLERHPIGFGLWKGDLTLKRAINERLRQMRARGEVEEIMQRYQLAPIQSSCTVCQEAT